jgi:hypothetical protein
MTGRVERVLTCANGHHFISTAQPGQSVRCKTCRTNTYIRKSGGYVTSGERKTHGNKKRRALAAQIPLPTYATGELATPESIAAQQGHMMRRYPAADETQASLLWEALQHSAEPGFVRKLATLAQHAGIPPHEYTYALFSAWGLLPPPVSARWRGRRS